MPVISNPNLDHQNFNAFPQVAHAPVVDEGGYITKTWYYFLVYMWKQLGQGMANVAGAVYLQQSAPGAPVDAFLSSTGALIGAINTNGSGGQGGPPFAVAPGPSPFSYTAVAAGTLFVSGATVSIKRAPNPAFVLVTTMGGAIPMLIGDIVQIEWFGTDIPVLTFFPFS